MDHFLLGDLLHMHSCEAPRFRDAELFADDEAVVLEELGPVAAIRQVPWAR